MIMQKQAYIDQITHRGKTRPFYPDELFYKFIKQFLCILDESYRIEQVTNGIFQTTLNLDKQQSVSDALLHPMIDLLKTELTDYVKQFCSDASDVLTFSQFKKVF